jgi:hypothetical protein
MKTVTEKTQQEQRQAVAEAAAAFLLAEGMTAHDMAVLAAARPSPTFVLTAQEMARRGGDR